MCEGKAFVRLWIGKRLFWYRTCLKTQILSFRTKAKRFTWGHFRCSNVCSWSCVWTVGYKLTCLQRHCASNGRLKSLRRNVLNFCLWTNRFWQNIYHVRFSDKNSQRPFWKITSFKWKQYVETIDFRHFYIASWEWCLRSFEQ